MRYFLYVFFFCLAFIFTGCFEVVEEITLNDDGSGAITMTVNISRSKTKLKSIMLMDSINNYKVPTREDITENMNKMVKEIESINGVSNVTQVVNFEDFIFSVSCDFTNVDVLNDVITHFSSEGITDRVTSKQFSYNKANKVFKRNYDFNLSEEIKKVRQKDREILDEASVTTIYRFESAIASADNAESRIAGNKKAVMLKINVPDMINNSKNIKNTITLK